MRSLQPIYCTQPVSLSRAHGCTLQPSARRKLVAAHACQDYVSAGWRRRASVQFFPRAQNSASTTGANTRRCAVCNANDFALRCSRSAHGADSRTLRSWGRPNAASSQPVRAQPSQNSRAVDDSWKEDGILPPSLRVCSSKLYGIQADTEGSTDAS